MKTIPLHPLKRGFFAIVDDAEYERLKCFRWRILIQHSRRYAFRPVVVDGKTSFRRLHREVLQVEDSVLVDHMNFNGLDCRRENLRPCDHSQNAMHRRLDSEIYRGVFCRYGEFYSLITVAGRKIRLGRYATAEAAARAYDYHARQHHGEFAMLNFPDEHAPSAPEPLPHRQRKRVQRQNPPSSGFWGVYRNAKGKKHPWVVKIAQGGKWCRCGVYETKEEAAMAYTEAAKRLHGAKAVLNLRVNYEATKAARMRGLKQYSGKNISPNIEPNPKS